MKNPKAGTNGRRTDGRNASISASAFPDLSQDADTCMYYGQLSVVADGRMQTDRKASTEDDSRMLHPSADWNREYILFSKMVSIGFDHWQLAINHFVT